MSDAQNVVGIAKAQARAQIDRWLNEYAEGGVEGLRAKAVALAGQAELDAAVVDARFAAADKLRGEAIAAKSAVVIPRRRLTETAEEHAQRLERERAKAAFFSTGPQPGAETAKPTQPAGKLDWAAVDWDEPVVAKAAKAAKVVRFHPSDEIKRESPPTIEQKNRALEVLADLRGTDPLEYAGQRVRWAKRLCTTVVAIDQAVKQVLAAREDDGKQSQATELVAIGVNKERSRLWCSPEGEPYATVMVDDHRENYRVESTSFDQWLHYEFGLRYRVKQSNGEYTPKAPGEGSVRDAIKELKGIAKYSKLVFSPVHRVGGDGGVIWIDLGGPDWRAVRVTAGGWSVVRDPGVAFVRTGTMLALPEPARGGSIEPLRKLINIQPQDFVLVPAWQLQALNPTGSYPLINITGQSEAGKTTASRTILRVVNPNQAMLRRLSRKIEDLLVAARNGWTIGIDNLSWMTQEWSDTFCQLSTGIATGTRKHYTNDEEHVYEVTRPVLFNGIPENLIQRGDLASRVIKLDILPITTRRTDADLEAEFQRAWPGMFGALLDGLVGGLRDAKGVDVGEIGQEPARLMDFEQFAEAGCRAMGFAKWEFARAYAVNRQWSMAGAVESSAVGRAVRAWMERHPNGFAGKMSALLRKLDTPEFRGLPVPKNWPVDATRLSTELARLVKPLAAISIACALRVDRRNEGGTQQDVVLTHKAPEADGAQ
jgi:hypothetical protein